MRQQVSRFIFDAFTWAFCIVLVGFLHAAGAVENAAFALASGALWFGIRAHSKSDVNSVRKNIEAQ